MNLIGIVQGRLSKSPKNRLQYFPKKWDKEFKIANELKYDFIEFFTERKFNKNNPIWSSKGIQNYKYFSKKNNLKILNFCDDSIISNSFKKKKTYTYLKKLLKNINKLGIKNLILPFYEKSLMTDQNYFQFKDNLIKLIKLNYKINILIESNISPISFSNLKKLVNSNKLKFLFDTGNRINLERDLYKDLLLFKKNLGHIHIKDKNSTLQNVPLKKGLVNFRKVFWILKKIKYKKNFTFETTRSNNPYKTAKKNIIFIKKLLNV